MIKLQKILFKLFMNMLNFGVVYVKKLIINKQLNKNV